MNVPCHYIDDLPVASTARVLAPCRKATQLLIDLDFLLNPDKPRITSPAPSRSRFRVQHLAHDGGTTAGRRNRLSAAVEVAYDERHILRRRRRVQGPLLRLSLRRGAQAHLLQTGAPSGTRSLKRAASSTRRDRLYVSPGAQPVLREGPDHPRAGARGHLGAAQGRPHREIRPQERAPTPTSLVARSAHGIPVAGTRLRPSSSPFGLASPPGLSSGPAASRRAYGGSGPDRRATSPHHLVRRRRRCPEGDLVPHSTSTPSSTRTSRTRSGWPFLAASWPLLNTPRMTGALTTCHRDRTSATIETAYAGANLLAAAPVFELGCKHRTPAPLSSRATPSPQPRRGVQARILRSGASPSRTWTRSKRALGSG